MAAFLCRLLPPRPTFAQDMSDAERQVMMAHVGYWTGLAREGKAVAFGPVMDPKGGWGCGIMEVADETEMKALAANDPAIKGSIGMKYEIFPMPQLVTRDKLSQLGNRS